MQIQKTRKWGQRDRAGGIYLNKMDKEYTVIEKREYPNI